MGALFDNRATGWPPGFSYVPGFIDPEEERRLLDFIATVDLKPFVFQGFEAKRKTKSFGVDYQFDGRKLAKGEEIPAELDFLIRKVAGHVNLKPGDFAEVLVTEYPPGSVINWHRDAPPFGLVAGISLLTGCVFRLRPYRREKGDRASTVSLPIGRRSLYVLDGESRESWEHSISPVRDTRFAITLRTLRAGEAQKLRG